jgi:hypothetical protein
MQAAERELRKVCEEREAEKRAAVLAFEDLKTMYAVELVAAQEAAIELAGLVDAQHDAEIAVAKLRVATLTKEKQELKKYAATLEEGRDQAAMQMSGVVTKVESLDLEARIAKAQFSEQLKDATKLAAELTGEFNRLQATNLELEASFEIERERLWLLKDQVATSDQQWRGFVLEVEELQSIMLASKTRLSDLLQVRIQLSMN